MPVYTHLDDDDSVLRVGTRIREQRKQRGWTIAELASRLSLSVGTVSALENQKMNVDVDLVLALCNTLDVPLETLLPRSTTRHFHISRRGQIQSQPALPLKLVNRATERLVSYHNRLWPLARPFVGKHLEPFVIEVPPLADADLRFIAHNHEEFVFVLQGRIECLLKTPHELAKATLGAGDCIYFWSHLPHCIRSAGADPARTIHLEYSQHDVADAEYGHSGDQQTVYMVDAEQENVKAQIAGKLVSLRRARGMSQALCAEQIGISVRRLKQIELAKRPISLDLLLQFCRTFQKPKEYFLPHSVVRPPYSYIVRSRQVRRQRSGCPPMQSGGCFRSATFRGLADGFPERGMQPFLVRLDHNARSPKLVAHPGQEFVYVLRGIVRFVTRHESTSIDEQLGPGDACFLDTSVPHAFAGASFTPYERAYAELLAVQWTPGLRADPDGASRNGGEAPTRSSRRDVKRSLLR